MVGAQQTAAMGRAGPFSEEQGVIWSGQGRGEKTGGNSGGRGCLGAADTGKEQQRPTSTLSCSHTSRLVRGAPLGQLHSSCFMPTGHQRMRWPCQLWVVRGAPSCGTAGWRTPPARTREEQHTVSCASWAPAAKGRCLEERAAARGRPPACTQRSNAKGQVTPPPSALTAPNEA